MDVSVSCQVTDGRDGGRAPGGWGVPRGRAGSCLSQVGWDKVGGRATLTPKAFLGGTGGNGEGCQQNRTPVPHWLGGPPALPPVLRVSPRMHFPSLQISSLWAV